MVRILANGDIVEDDDPRVRSTQPTQRPNTRIPPRQEHGDFAQQGQPISIFQVLNQKLLAFGIPRFNVGDLVVEPIVSVGLLLSLLLFGIPGLICGAILFAVSHWSTHGAPDFLNNLFGGNNGGGGDGRRGNRPHGRAGGGHRLGR